MEFLTDQFQSTLPVRGATREIAGPDNVFEFQSTLPVRGETREIAGPDNVFEFQSTLPVRGETLSRKGQLRAEDISIHAPRKGRDLDDIWLQGVMKDFNPRSPGGERHGLVRCPHVASTFQSTLPVRGATAKQHKGTGMFCDKCAIS